MDNSPKSVRTAFQHMEWISDFVVRVRIDDGADIDLEQAHESHEAMKSLVAGKTCGLLIDIRNTRFNVSPEARAFSSSREGSSTRVADAILVDSLANALVGNFYIRFNKPRIPTRIFKSEEKAMEWLARVVTKIADEKSRDTKLHSSSHHGR